MTTDEHTRTEEGLVDITKLPVAKEQENYPKGYSACVYLDRTDPMNTDTRLTSLIWEPDAKQNLDLRLSMDEKKDDTPIIRTEAFLALPEVSDDVLLWVSSTDDEGYYLVANGDDVKGLPDNELARAKSEVESDNLRILERVSWDEAQKDAANGKLIVRDYEAQAAAAKYGEVSKMSVERSRWDEKKKQSKEEPQYQKSLWVSFEGYKKDQAQLFGVDEWRDGKKTSLDIPTLDLGPLSSRDDKFLGELVLRVPTGPEDFKYYKFPLSEPRLPSSGMNQPYGVLTEMDSEEIARMEKHNVRVVEPDTLRSTWDNFGKVDKDTISWQLKLDAEDSYSRQAKEDIRQNQSRIEELRRGIEKFKNQK